MGGSFCCFSHINAGSTVIQQNCDNAKMKLRKILSQCGFGVILL
jgi:hypothetical protein